MFLVTQFLGLFVVNFYSSIDLPLGLEPAEEQQDLTLSSLAISFALAFILIFLLMRFKLKTVMRIWFLFVITLALTVSLTAIFTRFLIPDLILFIGLVLAILKVFRPTALIHNLTEVLIYPGIAAIFVTLLSPNTVIGLLVLISIYDMWAVWKTGVMQKMAKFQMEELKVFGGFLLPSADRKTREKIKLIKEKYKGKEIPRNIQKKKFKVNLAILGGGDVVFPIITAGVFMKSFGIIPAIWIIFGSFVGLAYLFTKGEKGKAYPAMPYISLGILFGLLVWLLQVA